MAIPQSMSTPPMGQTPSLCWSRLNPLVPLNSETGLVTTSGSPCAWSLTKVLAYFAETSTGLTRYGSLAATIPSRATPLTVAE